MKKKKKVMQFETNDVTFFAISLMSKADPNFGVYPIIEKKEE